MQICVHSRASTCSNGPATTLSCVRSWACAVIAFDDDEFGQIAQTHSVVTKAKGSQALRCGQGAAKFCLGAAFEARLRRKRAAYLLAAKVHVLIICQASTRSSVQIEIQTKAKLGIRPRRYIMQLLSLAHMSLGHASQLELLEFTILQPLLWRARAVSTRSLQSTVSFVRRA